MKNLITHNSIIKTKADKLFSLILFFGLIITVVFVVPASLSSCASKEAYEAREKQKAIEYERSKNAAEEAYKKLENNTKE